MHEYSKRPKKNPLNCYELVNSSEESGIANYFSTITSYDIKTKRLSVCSYDLSYYLPTTTTTCNPTRYPTLIIEQGFESTDTNFTSRGHHFIF